MFVVLFPCDPAKHFELPCWNCDIQNKSPYFPKSLVISSDEISWREKIFHLITEPAIFDTDIGLMPSEFQFLFYFKTILAIALLTFVDYLMIFCLCLEFWKRHLTPAVSKISFLWQHTVAIRIRWGTSKTPL